MAVAEPRPEGAAAYRPEGCPACTELLEIGLLCDEHAGGPGLRSRLAAVAARLQELHAEARRQSSEAAPGIESAYQDGAADAYRDARWLVLSMVWAGEPLHPSEPEPDDPPEPSP